MKTLEEILKQTENASLGGNYGINACKQSIKETIATNIKYNTHFGIKHYAEDYKLCLKNTLKKQTTIFSLTKIWFVPATNL